MALQPINKLKEAFKALATPTDRNFWDLIDSIWHKSEKMPITQVMGLNEALANTASKEDLANATTNFKGYHSTIAALQTAYPQAQNKKDWFAWVGSKPTLIWKVNVNGGVWVNTGDEPTEQEINLAEYAKIKNDKGETVVYAPEGGIKLDNYVSKEEVDYTEPQKPSSPNLFTGAVDGRRHSDETGLGYLLDGFSISTMIKVKIGDVVYLNSNQTVVFYTNDLFKVAYFIPSVSKIPELSWRKITIDKDVMNMSFTLATSWKPKVACYLNPDKDVIIGGISSDSILCEEEKTLTEVLSEMSAFDKGPVYGVKQSVALTGKEGIISQNGDVVYTVKNECLILESDILEKNSYYLLELGNLITGRIFSSLGVGKVKPSDPNVMLGIPLAIAGRKTTWFKTDDREGQKIHIFARATNLVIGVETSTFDISSKCKLYKVEEPYMASKVSKLPSVASDLSAFPSATIPEPQWIMWNINANLYDLTLTTDYSKESYVVEYLDSNGFFFRKYATIGGQGRTSMSFENHNLKCKLTNHDGSKFVLKIGNWLPRSTYHFKVNYVDFTQSKNQAGANFVHDWHTNIADKTKKTLAWKIGKVYNPNEVDLPAFDNRPRGVIGGVPCLITNYWNARSAGTMNLNRFAENYALDDKNPLHRGFKGDIDYTDKTRWEELCSDTEGEAMTQETWQPFYDFSKWMKDNSSVANVEAFKAGDGVKYNKIDLIDYWLLGELLWSVDNGWANQLWLSYDSVKFTLVWDDMDSCFGSNALGITTYAPTKEFRFHDLDLYLWTQVNRAYKDEIKNRYHALRASGRFSIDKFREIYGSYISRFPYEWYEMDFHMWRDRKSIKAGSFASLERILWFVENRLVYLDNKYGYVK